MRRLPKLPRIEKVDDEVRLARMEAFLSSKPRHPKTAAYVQTMPKQDVKARLRFERGKEAARRVIARCERGENIPIHAPERKDKLRPSRRKKASHWNCRGAHRHRDWKKDETGYRDMTITAKHRLLLYAAQDGICALCGKIMYGKVQGLSIDHVVPRSLGGIDGIGNLVLSHGVCNGAKSNDLPTGCEAVALFAVNARLGVYPQRY